MTGHEFRVARAELGLSARELAGEWGVSIRTIYRWEAGDTEVFPVAAYALRLMVDRARQSAAQLDPSIG